MDVLAFRREGSLPVCHSREHGFLSVILRSGATKNLLPLFVGLDSRRSLAALGMTRAGVLGIARNSGQAESGEL
jgi:hypothetical protein